MGLATTEGTLCLLITRGRGGLANKSTTVAVAMAVVVVVVVDTSMVVAAALVEAVTVSSHGRDLT